VTNYHSSPRRRFRDCSRDHTTICQHHVNALAHGAPSRIWQYGAQPPPREVSVTYVRSFCWFATGWKTLDGPLSWLPEKLLRNRAGKVLSARLNP
jgi:hypothetical protein